MNYIELINKFWELDETWQFSSCETRLYFYLLKTANRLGWMDSFIHGDEKTAANVGVSKNTLKTSRNKLVKACLINFTEGGKGHGNKTRYQIMTPKATPSLIAKLDPNANPNPQPKVDPLLTKQKLNQTKQEKEEKPVLIFPYSSKKFLDLWEQLLKTPKWKKKIPHSLQLALDKLKDFEEDFSINLLEQAIIGEWQGLVFQDTKAKYELWKNSKNKLQHPIANYNNNIIPDERF